MGDVRIMAVNLKDLKRTGVEDVGLRCSRSMFARHLKAVCSKIASIVGKDGSTITN
jgi:hypothetical protein